MFDPETKKVGLYGRRPLVDRMNMLLPMDLPIKVVYGDNDWLHSSPGCEDAVDMLKNNGMNIEMEIMKNAGTIVWNGPVGVFEFEQFANGTEKIAHAIAASDAFSIAGGGDTLAAVGKFNIEDKISYISTGGGAFLEFLEGKTLPVVEVLEKKMQEQDN